MGKFVGRWVAMSLASTVMMGIVASASWAGRAGEQGICMANGRALQAYNNSEVLAWKNSTPNAWKGRGFVSGVVTQLIKDRPGHLHWIIQIGSGSRDLIEIVYNTSFGKLPELRLGMEMAVCGDYITANARTGKYPPSPVDAIIHWVHGSNNGRHEDGFIAVAGKIYGQEGDARR